MTDVPPGSGQPGDASAPYEPQGVRRSTFTPPDAEAEAPAFDDDALADALAAEVSSYTAPVPVTPPSGTIAPAPAPAAPPADESDVVPPPAEQAPAEQAPEQQAPESAGWGEPAPVADVPAAQPWPLDDTTTVAEPHPTPDSMPIPTGPDGTETHSSTLEAIERLENELRRRAEEARVAAEEARIAAATPPPLPEPFAPETFGAPDGPRFPAPPTYLRPAPPDEVPAVPDLPVTAEPPALVEPPSIPPAYEPPAFEPPVFEPPAYEAPVEPAAVETPPFEAPPVSAPIDLPPPPNAGFAHLPPPTGLEPAPIAPAAPSGPIDLPATDFDALLERRDAVPQPHPDDLGSLPPPTFVPAPLGEDADVIDDVDRVFGGVPIAVAPSGAIDVVHPPSEPIPTQRLSDAEAALVDEEPESHPALTVESAGAEATALDLRAGRAARLFWLWFAANSSIVSLSLGAVIFGLGMSLRQVLMAVPLGIALSFLPLGLGTLAGKWSGQPTMVVSRATFGLAGNALPTILAVVSRLFWGAALLWLLATGVARVLVDAGLDAGLGEQIWTFVALGVGFLITFVVAIFGYGLIARVQLVLSILTALLVVGVIAITYPRLDLAAAQAVDDGPWTLLVSGVVLVFSLVGLAWVHSTADVARYQRTDSDGGSSMLWAAFGATLPAFLLVAWGGLLAASDPLIADGLATNPLYTIAALLPAWYPAPLIAALALGLLSGAILTVYSGGFAIQALGLRIRRSGATVVAGLLVLALAAALLLLVGDAQSLLRDVATTIAVPVAAWAGIFGAEIMIRRRGFDSDALLRRGGVYPSVRWANLLGLVVITAVGFGLTSAALPGLDWQGYLFPYLPIASGDPLVTSDVGVLVALVLGILLPLITAVPAIRRQERALVD
jgi:purine-cytosine permease-like protein